MNCDCAGMRLCSSSHRAYRERPTVSPPLQQHIGLLMLSVTTKLEATQKFGVAGRLFPVFFFPGVAFGGAWSEGPS